MEIVLIHLLACCKCLFVLVAVVLPHMETENSKFTASGEAATDSELPGQSHGLNRKKLTV